MLVYHTLILYVWLSEAGVLSNTAAARQTRFLEDGSQINPQPLSPRDLILVAKLAPPLGGGT